MNFDESFAMTMLRRCDTT